MNEAQVQNVSPSNQTLTERITRVFTAQQANRNAIAQTTAKQRIEKLEALLHAINRNKQNIRDALFADYRKPAPEVDLSEIYPVVSEIKHAIRHLRTWMKPKRVRPTLVMLATKSWLRYEPKGNVLIISPWNFPFTLALGPLVSAVAAGNCIIVKPSEYTPHTSQLMKDMIEEIFSENEIAFFLGDKEVATELLKKPFNHIFFTGSPQVGKVVMKAAAEHLATVTLELGGKSPVIVDDSADLKDAAEKIAWGKFLNNGQTCLAPDYLYVHDKVYPDFLDEMKRAIQNSFGRDETQRQKSPDYARIVSQRHHQRLQSLQNDSVKQGAKIEMGGVFESEERYIAPTILTETGLDSPVMQDEIFGPILPVRRYKSLQESVHVIQSLPRPLALYVFSRNRRNIDYIISNTTAGSSCINVVVIQFMHLNLPFGGINTSGFGNSHGFYGFKAFSHERPILKQRRLTPLKLLYPPYNKRATKFIDLMLKYLS